MYTIRNFKTKKALREAVKNGERVEVFQPGPFASFTSKDTGMVSLEGPHGYHTWYAIAEIKDRIVVKVK
tara:strand:- start:720 stop:926 length:207 start_codon:yes stop_codon:yes gene_type:complete